MEFFSLIGIWMRRVRTNIRFGAWCALFALAIQFTVSFGHVHAPENVASAGGLAPAALSDHGRPAALPDAPAAPSKPAGLGFDYCAICAVMNLAASALPAAAPALPVQTAFHPAPFWPQADTAQTAAAHRPFEARGPPLA
jgi:hypothetical protein